MIKVITHRNGHHNFEADSFRIDDGGRLVLLRKDEGSDTQIVAVWAEWIGVYQSTSVATK